eukprot:comp21793_c0_seq1/m.30974 comp21793_c0_seq1/g.30974  ORF comp21793_c0_seq1/g.30974 comp21793_c0_seq1/m.30974 type:complete len:426 (+) comp21793_c0_seq1:206-1483(+)
MHTGVDRWVFYKFCGGCGRLEGNVAVLLGGVLLGLPLQDLEVLADALAGGGRLDDVINKPSGSSGEGCAQGRLVLALLCSQVLGPTEDNGHGTLGTHDGNFGRGPCVVGVTAQVLGAHHVVGTTVGLARNHGNLGDGGLGIGVQQLGTVANDTAILLGSARQETRHIHERQQGDVEGIAEPHKPGTLDGGIDVEAAGGHGGLVADHTDSAAIHACKADNDVASKRGHDLEELTVINNLLDDGLHAVGLVGAVGHHRVEGRDVAVSWVIGDEDGGGVLVGEGQVADHLAQTQQRIDVVVEGTVSNTGLLSVGDGTAQLLLGDHLVGDGFNDIGAGDEHVGGVLDHEGVVGHGRGVHGTTSAGTHDEGQLGDDTGRQDVPLEDIGIAGERLDTLLDTGSAGVVEADDGCTHHHGLVHDLADFACVRG